eukprot:scaffold210580_cov39-Tisochrysis_lutea.AAC.1
MPRERLGRAAPSAAAPGEVQLRPRVSRSDAAQVSRNCVIGCAMCSRLGRSMLPATPRSGTGCMLARVPF